jgi:hypothetical protein
MMKKLFILVFMACLTSVQGLSEVQAQATRSESVTPDEALAVCQNWVTLITAKHGAWGGSGTAQAVRVQEFTQDNRLLAYFCAVEPRGYVLVSLRKELPPVMVSSEVDDLDPDANAPMVDLLHVRMAATLDAIEQRVGHIESAPTGALLDFLESDYRGAWTALSTPAVTFKQQPVAKPRTALSRQATANYSEGQVLLSTNWHQVDPYNQECLIVSPCTNRCPAGCVAIAHAQIMRHWAWPPYGVGSPYDDVYDWPRILDNLTAASYSTEIDAAAELIHEVGAAVYMHYCEYGDNCNSSSAMPHEDELYKTHYRYSDAGQYDQRRNYATAADWFNHLKAQFQLNQPVYYTIPGHAVVADGWREVYIGGVLTMQYHINYGHANNNTAWWTVDNIPGGAPNDEDIYENILPVQTMGDAVNGTYSLLDFPYRYFNRDAVSTYGADLASGQYLQFLAGVKLTCAGGSIRFNGDDRQNTHLYSNGDPTSGIRIDNGLVQLNRNGGITFRPVGAPRYVRAEINTGAVQITWEQGTGRADGFEIQRRTATGTYASIATVGPNVTTFTDSTVVQQTGYHYRLRATRGEGFSGYSNEADIFVP